MARQLRLPGQDDERDRQRGEAQEDISPALAHGQGRREDNGTQHHPYRAGQGPQCHILLTEIGVQVHQRRLGQADERARRGVKEEEGHQQHREGCSHAGQGERGREHHPTADNQQASPSRVGQDADDGFDGGGPDLRQGEEQAYGAVRQMEIVPDERPGRLARAEDQLVEQLDEQENDD